MLNIGNIHTFWDFKAKNNVSPTMRTITSDGEKLTKNIGKINYELKRLDKARKGADSLADVKRINQQIDSLKAARTQIWKLGRASDKTKEGLMSMAQSIPGVGLMTNPYTLGAAAVAGLGTVVTRQVRQQADLAFAFRNTSQEILKMNKGLTEAQAQAGAMQLHSLGSTFKLDTSQLQNATDTLFQTFRGNYVSNAALLEKALLAGGNAQGELNDSVREYSHLAKEAGLSQEQFLEVITRSSRARVYSDKGIDAIKEASIRLREQTKGTRTALENAFGKQFADTLFKDINSGAVTVFEATQRISRALKDAKLTAAQTGPVIADVFGGPGEDAGLEFLKLIGDVNGELDALIDRADPATRRILQIKESNDAAAAATADLSDSLKLLGTSYETFWTDVGTVTARGTSWLLNSIDVLVNGAERAGAQLSGSLARQAAALGSPKEIKDEISAIQEKISKNEELLGKWWHGLSHGTLSSRNDAYRETIADLEASIPVKEEQERIDALVTKALAANNAQAIQRARAMLLRNQGVYDSDFSPSNNKLLQDFYGQQLARFQPTTDYTSTSTADAVSTKGGKNGRKVGAHTKRHDPTTRVVGSAPQDLTFYITIAPEVTINPTTAEGGLVDVQQLINQHTENVAADTRLILHNRYTQ